MDEQNKAPASVGGDKKEHHKKHKNRHRHGGRRPEGAEGRQSGQPQVNGEAAVNTPKKEQHGENRQPKDSKGEGGNQNRQKNQNRRGNQNGNQGRNDKQNGGNRGDQNQKKKKQQNGGNYSRRGPEDLYGHPTEDDVLTMDELRAKIVLKSADGTTPEKAAAVSAAPAEEIALSPDQLIPLGDELATPPSPEDSVEVVGIRFRTSGKVYYFDPKKNKLTRGSFAIVETARGPEFGEVTFGNRMVRKSATVSPLRPVLRIATEADVAHNEDNIRKEKEALVICQRKIAEHKLDMKLIDVQYAFDNSKLLFYFTSEGRVDFRNLVKDLATVFRTRIELRQIGIRDEAKMLGGLGVCGRPLCCATFLPDFVQVSIKMAKEQGLSLNSSKISGVCGRLMCCLRYESEVYAEEIRRTPPVDSTVNTPDGVGTVIGMSPLAGTVKVLLKNVPDTPPKQYRREEVTVLGRERSGEKSSDKKPENSPSKEISGKQTAENPQKEDKT